MMSEEDAFCAPSNNITGKYLLQQQPHEEVPVLSSNPNNPNQVLVKRKRSLPGTPDPDAEVIALSPKSLMETNRFICEICKKGFQRDQNLQLHRRGHNLPWKLKQRTSEEEAVRKKKVYVCPEKSCVHHDPSRALGDLTGIKKHFSRKHGEKKWNCHKCSKKYAVQSDWKAHTKICGTREYTCHCGTLFSRKDSFITHRAFCEALAEQSVRMMTSSSSSSVPSVLLSNDHLISNNAAHQASLLGFQHHHEFGGGSIPEPFMGNLADHHAHKLKLPLWLDQANSSSHHHLNNIIIPLSSNHNNTNSSGNTVHDLVQTMNMFGSLSQTPWPPMNYGYSSSEAGGGASFAGDNNNSVSNMGAAAAMALGGVMKREEEEENKLGDEEELLSHSVMMMSSLYSSSLNCQNHQQGGGGPSSSSSHHMSATALLQKATQMESTRNNNNNNEEILKQAAANVENTNNNEMVMMNSSFVIEEGNGWENPHYSSSNKNKNKNEQQLGLTRDFLGVGGDQESSSSSIIRRISRPFLLQQQHFSTKFDSMGSLINLQTHFGTGHQS